MDQIKKHLFWIILGVVVLGALGLWFTYMPDLDAAKSAALAPASDLKSNADKSSKDNGLPTAEHAKAAAAYSAKLDAEKKALLDTMAKWADFSTPHLNTLYPGAPQVTDAGRNFDAIKFDLWMADQRKRITDSMTKKGIAFSQADFDRWTLSGLNVDTEMSKKSLDLNSKTVAKHRDYQLRQLAIIDEIVRIFTEIDAKIPIAKFEADIAKEENKNEEAKIGVLQFVSFTFHTPEDIAKSDEKSYADALKRSGWARNSQAAPEAGFKGADMPVTLTSVDVEFVSHLSIVPGILRKVESSGNYTAIITKADFERVGPLFTGPVTETTVQSTFAKAAFIPTLNTHYGEGPVKTFVTLTFYEFDKAKAEKLDPVVVKPAAGAGPVTRPVTTTRPAATH